MVLDWSALESTCFQQYNFFPLRLRQISLPLLVGVRPCQRQRCRRGLVHLLPFAVGRMRTQADHLGQRMAFRHHVHWY